MVQARKRGSCWCSASWKPWRCLYRLLPVSLMMPMLTQGMYASTTHILYVCKVRKIDPDDLRSCQWQSMTMSLVLLLDSEHPASGGGHIPPHFDCRFDPLSVAEWISQFHRIRVCSDTHRNLLLLLSLSWPLDLLLAQSLHSLEWVGTVKEQPQFRSKLFRWKTTHYRTFI